MDNYFFDHPELMGPPSRAVLDAAAKLGSEYEWCAYVDARVNNCTPKEAYAVSREVLADMIEWADRAMGDWNP